MRVGLQVEKRLKQWTIAFDAPIDHIRDWFLSEFTRLVCLHMEGN